MTCGLATSAETALIEVKHRKGVRAITGNYYRSLRAECKGRLGNVYADGGSGFVERLEH